RSPTGTPTPASRRPRPGGPGWPRPRDVRRAPPRGCPTGSPPHPPRVVNILAGECLHADTRSRILAYGYTPPDRQAERVGEEMAGRRAVSNPLALAVLVTLCERPMHPYEMASTMRSRGKERSIKLNYGSLYTVVNNLARHGLIEAMGAGREGWRPERTVYRVTEAGRKELDDWMAELVAVPVKEYPQFEAALSELPVL